MGCSQSKATDVAVPTAAAVPVTSEGKDLSIDHETLASKTLTEELQNDQEAQAIDDKNQEEEEDKDQVLPETPAMPVSEPITDVSVTPDSVSVDVPDSVRANFSSFNISFIDPSVSAPTSATTEPNVASMRIMSDKMLQRGDDNVGESDDRVDRVDKLALELKSVEGGEMQQVNTIEGDEVEVEAGKERGEERLDVEEESVDNSGDGEAVAEDGAVGTDVEQVGALEALVKEEKVVVEERASKSSGESEVVELVHVETGVELMTEKKSAEILVEQGDDLLEGEKAAGSFEEKELVESLVDVRSVEKKGIAELAKEEGLVDTIEKKKTAKVSVDDEPTELVEEKVNDLVNVAELEKTEELRKVDQLEKAEVSVASESPEPLEEEKASDFIAEQSVGLLEETAAGSIAEKEVIELVTERLVAELVKDEEVAEPIEEETITEPGVKDVVEVLVDEKTIEPVEMKMDATTIKLVEVVATGGTAVVAGTSDVAGEPDVVANTEQTEAVA